jgi:hypothetical protein
MSAARKALVVLAVIAALVGAPAASADRPVMEPFVFDDFTTAAGEVCSFPLSFETVRNDVVGKFFTDGRLIVTGQFVARITNLASEESIEVNTSGPATLVFNQDGSVSAVARGNTVFILFAGRDAGGPALLLTNGRVDFTFAPEGFISSISPRGHVTDLCAILAE